MRARMTWAYLLVGSAIAFILITILWLPKTFNATEQVVSNPAQTVQTWLFRDGTKIVTTIRYQKLASGEIWRTWDRTIVCPNGKSRLIDGRQNGTFDNATADISRPPKLLPGGYIIYGLGGQMDQPIEIFGYTLYVDLGKTQSGYHKILSGC